jgi:hypothetical protein
MPQRAFANTLGSGGWAILPGLLEAAAGAPAQHLAYGSAIVPWVPHCSPVLRTVRGLVPVLLPNHSTVLTNFSFRYPISGG